MAGVQYSFRDFKKLLENNGYVLMRKRGSHRIFINAKGDAISINIRPNAMVCKRLIKEHKLNDCIKH